MGATQSSDIGFEPKVFADHVQAYFRKKLMFGAVAAMDESLESEPGTTVHFPYFKAIGDAEEPAENEGLNVDRLQDDAFSCTVKEVGKAVGWKDKAFRKSAARREEILSEAQKQVARRFAEKTDADLVTLVNTSGNYVQGYTATSSAHTMNIRILNQARITGFGDRMDEAVAVYMHSKQFLDLMNDSTAGFLKADANDPFYGRPGFQGRLLGMALFITDQTPATSAQIDSTDAKHAFIVKENPYGICVAERPEIESDRDILARETVIASTTWYGTVGLHRKVASDDDRVARVTTTVSS